MLHKSRCCGCDYHCHCKAVMRYLELLQKLYKETWTNFLTSVLSAYVILHETLNLSYLLNK